MKCALAILLLGISVIYAARISVSRGKNATKMENLCARMHNNTALEGATPAGMKKDTAYECQKQCVDMWPKCQAVVYYYMHNETKHHFCYLFEENSVHPKVELVEQKPGHKKDLVRMLEIVQECHQFDSHPPLEEDGVASSTDKVDRKKRQNGDEHDLLTMGEWTDWSDCSNATGHAVRSQACEYGRRIQRRGCPARQPPQRVDPRTDPRYMQQVPQSQYQDTRQDPRYWQQQQQQAQQHQERLHHEQLRQQQAQHAQAQKHQPAQHADPRQDPRYLQQLQQQQQQQPQRLPQEVSHDPRQDPRYLQQLAEHQQRIQEQQQRQQKALQVHQQQYAQQYQQRVGSMRHPAQPQAQSCTDSDICAQRPQPPTQQQIPTQPPYANTPTRYRPAPPPPPVCKGDGCLSRQDLQQGQWHDWSDWSECSCTCGDGLKSRRRECDGNNCQGPSIENAPCNMGPCQTWSEWCEWSECKGSCGRGERTRTRFCHLGTGRCEGKDFEVDVCNAGPCPEWSEWEDWTQCSVSCGNGIVSRQRTCLGGIHGDHMCPGNRHEEKPCELGPCSVWEPWQNWSPCSASCGDGMKRRIRICQYGNDCNGPAEESLFCYGPPCSSWTEWCEWSGCSARCGPGQRSRTRACLTSDNLESTDCMGPSHETVLCNNKDCCQYSEWCPWSQCDKQCGNGVSFRTRVCQRNGVNDDTCECLGPDRESRECNSHPCEPQCAWTEWCAWSDCSTPSACELGVQTRSRQCVGEPGCHCLGLAEENQQCRGAIPCTPNPPC